MTNRTHRNNAARYRLLEPGDDGYETFARRRQHYLIVDAEEADRVVFSFAETDANTAREALALLNASTEEMVDAP